MKSLNGYLDIMSYFTQSNLEWFLDQFRALGPLPGILLTFLKSFIPPMPTIVIVGVNAAVYGLWAGFLYSWIGMVAGCFTTFLLVRKISGTPLIERWAKKPKVQRGMRWIQRNGFSYVFLLGILPVGPFVAVNVAAGLARMNVMSYLMAVTLGKGIMVFCVSYIGANLSDLMAEPFKLLGVLAFILLSLWSSRKLDSYFVRKQSFHDQEAELNSN
ncbi:TVP38/TMEM64 family protein [Paenibacillus lautus]|uniref:TVP38/TMEM64 family membrane protein n=1 Tax=Paenibacillus lautus TaxID=1401 RepID=A0A385TM34_PAELA|nr:TVP38/TMEM64 family protein [Paenibacillus lautus]AYB43662.1 TVP38/TMEM64 family protein [Paenibacillus lautus]MCI1776140.1 TVP38/TMEM64 family protein [Paenibacillus lautus]